MHNNLKRGYVKGQVKVEVRIDRIGYLDNCEIFAFEREDGKGWV